MLNVFEVLQQSGAIERDKEKKYEVFPKTYAPLRVNFQKLLGRPRDFDIITDFLAEEVREANPDRIMGAFTSGVSLATAVSLKTNLPVAFVRREPKHFGDREIIIGEIKQGEKVVIIDDVYTTLRNNLDYINNLRKYSVIITHYIVIFNYNMESKTILSQEGIKLASLLSAKELLTKLEKRGEISKKEKEEMLRELKRPYRYN